MITFHVSAANMGAHYSLADVQAEDESEAVTTARAESRRRNYGMNILDGLHLTAYPCTRRSCGLYFEHARERGERS